MGFCRLSFLSCRLFFHDSLGGECLYRFTGQIRRAAGFWHCFPHLLAGDYQSAHGHGISAGGGDPAAPVQLRRFITHDHPYRHRPAHEYPHAQEPGLEARAKRVYEHF